MLTSETKKHIDAARQVLVGKVPDPKQQIDQITNALIYKFMDDMDIKAKDAGGKASFFTGDLEQYAWTKLMDPRKGAQERLNMYTEALEKFSTANQLPQLFRDIFRQAFLPYRDPETLNLFLKEIEYFDYNHSEELGNGFEYLLSIMGSQGDAGQFRTPRHIIDFIVDIIDPDKDDTILDPACGTAGFLISAYKHVVGKHDGVDEDGKKNEEVPLTHQEKQKLMGNLEGYDISSDMVKLARVNMYLHGYNQPKIFEYDSLTSEERWSDSFDVILANPPFMSPRGGIRPHNKFGVESSRAEVLFVDYIMSHLKQNGRAGIIVPEGIIFQSGKAYKQLRKALVEDGLLAVISLPAGVFNPYSGVKTSVLVFDNNSARKSSSILFAKVENDGFDLGAQRRPIAKNDLPALAMLLRKYREKPNADINSLKDELVKSKDFFTIGKSTIGGQDAIGSPEDFRHLEVATVSRTELAKTGEYNLSASRYVVAEVSQNQKWPMIAIDEVAEVKRGTSITSRDLLEGNVPVVAGGQKPAYYHSQANREAPVITVSGSGAYAGFINYFTEPIFVSDSSSVKSSNENTVLTRYLYWVLKGNQEKIYALRSGMAQPHVYAKDLAKFQIPLPPIEVQKEIIAELDGYQKIIDGARQIIEIYKPTIKTDPAWDVVKLGDIGPVRMCKRILKHQTTNNNTDIPFFKIGTFGKKPDAYIPQNVYQEYKSKYPFPNKGDVLISASGTIGKTVVYDGKPAYFQDSNIVWIENNEKRVTNSYLNVVLQSIKWNAQIGGTIARLYNDIIMNTEVVLPPIGVQQQLTKEYDEEARIIDANKRLLKIYEQKIQDKIAEVWGN